MNARYLNGASLHAERPAGEPDANQCWLEAVAARTSTLRSALADLGPVARCAADVTDVRRRLAELAQQVSLSEHAALERARDRLAEYDAETDQVLAETGGRVKRARAALEHRRNPAARGGLSQAPEDLAVLEAELREAEREDGRALARRLAGHERLRREWRAIAHGALASGIQFLALVEADRPAMETAARRETEVRRELHLLDTLTEHAKRTTT